jgi:hypothetical protein
VLLGTYLALLEESARTLGDAYRGVAEQHGDEPDVATLCRRFGRECDTQLASLAPLVGRYGTRMPEASRDLTPVRFGGPRTGGLGLLRDLHDLWLLAQEAHLCWTILRQAGAALRDDALLVACDTCGSRTDGQSAWLRTRIKAAAPQALVVAS